MSYKEEFDIIEEILGTQYETRYVDSFSLCLIKAERQIRRIFTYLIFQNENFDENDTTNLRETLAKSKRLYFEGFIKGIDILAKNSIKDILPHDYDALLKEISSATKYRNKIFHGQLTEDCLSREQLSESIEHIRSWCSKLSTEAKKTYGYCGFERNSFHKSNKKESELIKTKISDINAYGKFIKDHMER
ncbi:Uncharacterised protein [Serratia quinivorans]|uniref:hypothetical protein n=1 Tax=Serratia TaxID=613 RepID=UPI000F9341C4|nr:MULTISPECIES: hypothetical protein [Serratia]CAI1102569.1 Uncharacterised protein [Serratia ficaria]CAI1858849.1 Uncharacterised protein [Serratia quinivorans]CAI1902059.1 Uncharacterised protein [Serratia ficaria]CAI1944499.1 Uncharacterised protein [Serratia quinivorans]